MCIRRRTKLAFQVGEREVSRRRSGDASVWVCSLSHSVENYLLKHWPIAVSHPFPLCSPPSQPSPDIIYMSQPFPLWHTALPLLSSSLTLCINRVTCGNRRICAKRLCKRAGRHGLICFAFYSRRGEQEVQSDTELL